MRSSAILNHTTPAGGCLQTFLETHGNFFCGRSKFLLDAMILYGAVVLQKLPAEPRESAGKCADHCGEYGKNAHTEANDYKLAPNRLS